GCRAFELRKGLLKLLVRRQRPRYQPRRARSGSIGFCGMNCSGHHLGMTGQAQVVVRGEQQHVAACDTDDWTRARFQRQQPPRQMLRGQLLEVVFKHTWGRGRNVAGAAHANFRAWRIGLTSLRRSWYKAQGSSEEMGAPDHLVSMSYRIKVPTKTLQVDEAHLLSGLEHQLHRLQEYRRPLLVGLAVLLLAAAAVGGVFWLDRQASEKTQELDREASSLLMARSTADPKNAESLLKQAMAKYREIVEQYPRTAAAPLALFHLGNAQFQANDLAAAIDTYQRFLVLYGGNPALGALVQQRLAYSYLLKGDRDQAAKAFSAIVGSPG